MAAATKTEILAELETLDALLAESGNLYATREAHRPTTRALINQITADSIDPEA